MLRRRGENLTTGENFTKHCERPADSTLEMPLIDSSFEPGTGAVSLEQPRSADSGRAPRDPAPAEPITPTGPSVMLVDDDPHLLRQLRRSLRRAGFSCREFESGDAALREIDEVDVDLAIVDLHMPGTVSGIDVVEALRERRGDDVHITVLSGEDDNAQRVRCFDAGASDFVAKPAFLPELLKRLEAAHGARDTRRRLQAERERANRLLLFAEEATALLAHDLNNGFAVALSNVDFLLEYLHLTGEELKALASAKSAIERMAGLVSNFVDTARLEDEGMTVHRTEVAIAELFRTMVEIHTSALSRRDCTLSVECPADLVVRVDAALVERVLHNLFGNAIRYVEPEGHLVLRARERPGGGVIIEVGNTGRPVPPQIRGTLFDKYVHGEDRRCRGMGLYFSRLACEAHGGSIRLSDDPEMTTFVAELTEEQ